jgi:hypothetical protein
MATNQDADLGRRFIEEQILILDAGKLAEARRLRGPKWQPDFVRTSFHEAAHVVVQRVLKSGFKGRVSIVPLPHIKAIGGAAGATVGGYAGFPPGPDVTELPVDRSRIDDLCALLVYPRSTFRIKRSLRRKAKSLVKKHWPAITLLARELARKRELSQEEIAQILTTGKPLPEAKTVPFHKVRSF